MAHPYQRPRPNHAFENGRTEERRAVQTRTLDRYMSALKLSTPHLRTDGRALMALGIALTCLAANAGNIGRQGGDPTVHMGSHFVRSLLAEPMPRMLGPLFYARAVVGLTGDRESLGRFDPFLEEAALDRAIGSTPPERITIREALQKHEFNEARWTAKRRRVVDQAIAVLPPERKPGEETVTDKVIHVQVVNRSSLPIVGFSARLAIRPAGRVDWLYSECRARDLRLGSGEKAPADCVRTTYGRSFVPEEGIVPQTARWHGVLTEVTLIPQAVSFGEEDAPDVVFTVFRERSGASAVDLKESPQARELALARLREASCWARGSCLGDRLSDAFNANPFGISMLAGVVGGLLLVPLLLPARRHARKIAGGLSLGVVAASVALCWMLVKVVGGWGPALIPLVVLAAGGAIAALWIGAVLLGRRRAPVEGVLRDGDAA